MTNKKSLMIFFDGSAKRNENGGIGYVIQTNTGRVLEENYGRLEKTDSMVAEATALREALKHLKRDYPQAEVVYIKGDNRGIINSVKPEEPICVTGNPKPIVREIRDMLQEFEIVSSSLVKNRDLNEKAHNLAEKGRTHYDSKKIVV